MNERIRELAFQAFDLANNEIEAKNEGRQGMDGQLGIMYRTFAELIVRECLTVINQPNGVGDDDVIRISEDVKKHFGVEE